ncbi:hypothetical protein CAPTEDRAFT_160818 [Capitella teleta]|uniref:Gamma-glutamylcyclotransferase family protein n=1 Tax=Capitella teleta TaxID=283909 RepID=R7TVD3_CAPTE|nr:hypothetical protein CAPTEDRAFT_160818 [Capitella teleta]|eukprot:ELT95426.1 hypothetical protein CAPTEDRAFT_160818 [Capitella teleta]
MTAKATQLIFIYGTLKKGQPNHPHLCETGHGNIKFIGKAFTEQIFPLIVATKWNLPFLLHKSGHGKIVRGEVYEADSAMVSWLDEFEGHPEVYERDLISVVLEGSASQQSLTCQTYFLKIFPDGLLKKPALDTYTSREEQPYTIQ